MNEPAPLLRDPAGASGADANARDRQAAERDRALLRATLDATADGVVVVTATHEVLLINLQFLRMWNMPPSMAEASADDLIAFIGPQVKDPELYVHRVRELLRSPETGGFDLIECLDGRVIERYSSPIRTEFGVAARVLSYRDVTARVVAERAAREALEAAEAANRAKSDFLDNVSHEIRTPLNGVLGLTRLLLAEPLTPHQRKYVELADASARSLLDLIEDLLDLGKIESGRMELEDAPFDLHELLRELHEMYGVQARQKGLKFTVEVDPRVPQAVSGDATRLRQVLHNLLSNALKFTTRGEFGMFVGRAEPSRGEHMLRFTVFDTGIGIPFETQQRLFTRFTQADRATSRRYGGTGLGLAIVEQLCDMMGGSILLQSEPGRGASFRCELPLRAVPLAALPATAPGVRPPTRPSHATRVLVAEDNATNQVVVLGLLAQAGYADVCVVADGHQALEAMAAQAFDLVLMDCRMPHLDGYEAARQLRERGYTQPIIALTANAAAGERERCLAWGMNDYLAKPVDAARLAQVLAEWTGHPAPVAAPPAAAHGAPQEAFERAAALEQLGGDEELLAVALASFREHAPLLLAQARAALDAKAAADLRRHLHSLAGSASLIGAQPVQRLARELEVAAEAGALQAVASGLVALQEALEQFLAASARW